MKKRLEEMEAEASKLRALQMEVDKAATSASGPGDGLFGPFFLQVMMKVLIRVSAKAVNDF